MQRKTAVCLMVVFSFICNRSKAQELHSRWDELTASEWPKALSNVWSNLYPFRLVFSKNTAPMFPSDPILSRYANGQAGQQKKNMQLFSRIIFTGRSMKPGTSMELLLLPERIVWDLLEATCDEIARNGFKKIVIINGHGGNPELIRYFIQTRLGKATELCRIFF